MNIHCGTGVLFARRIRPRRTTCVTALVSVFFFREKSCEFDIIFCVFPHRISKISKQNRESIMELPRTFHAQEVDRRWQEYWKATGVYAWDPTRTEGESFTVDTPPPTVSGVLHVGHMFSYSHQDFVVRYQRMRQRAVFFPIGWDDNGLPTERRVQNLYNVRCEPHVPYDPNLKLERGRKGEPIPISRKNFIEVCHTVTREDEEAFRRLWTRLGMSYDWSLEYATIDDHCRRTSQASFLELLKQGEIYQAEGPVMWDVDFRTAIAQAEVVDREIPGAYYFLRFAIENSQDYVVIATTRPELLPACVAVLAHPEDDRYREYIGRRAVTPMFHTPLPIMADAKADPEKGTGIVMVCTFGDQTDVEWQREYNLPVRQILDPSGRLAPVRFVKPEEADADHRFTSLNPGAANAIYSRIQGKCVQEARERLMGIAEEIGGSSPHACVIDRRPQAVTHVVRFFEKGERPLELIPTRQWYCRLLAHKEVLMEQGRKVTWHPSHMGIRYEHWVQGLNQDWCLSRQRFFGVPIPVWYKVGSDGQTHYDQLILPEAEHLPVDPLGDSPPGYTEEQRDRPGGFTGDPDVLDTWATSSLTPQIATHWVTDKGRHAKLFPMDIRPQSHEIIRTWAFYTIVKAYLHERAIPWKNVVISGWVLDPDRKKMSKSRGNVATPEPLIEQYGADSVRYWSGRARLGVDTAYDEQMFKVGKRLCTKLFNASRLTVSSFASIDRVYLSTERILAELDRAVISELRPVIERATTALDQFDYAQALQVTEDFFWKTYCDNYLELAKPRIYEEGLTPGRLSAAATLRGALRTVLRLFAPFLPHLTEEVWHWAYNNDEDMHDSIHRSPWPNLDEFATVPKPWSDRSYEIVLAVVEAVRKAKAERNLSMKAPVAHVVVTVAPHFIETFEATRDIRLFEIAEGRPGPAIARVETFFD